MPEPESATAPDWQPSAQWLEIDRPQREGAERVAAWIRQRIEEDRLIAADVEDHGEWHCVRNDENPLIWADVVTADEDDHLDEYVADDVGRSNAVHIATHDPVRVLGQCDALGDVLTELERIAQRAPHPDPRSWARAAISCLAQIWGDAGEVGAVYLGEPPDRGPALAVFYAPLHDPAAGGHVVDGDAND
jgi:hypothetical protein